jgi:hypothetical protein
MTSFEDNNHNEPSSSATTSKSQRGQIKSEILRLVDLQTEIYNNNRWSVIDDLLKQILVVSSTTATTQPCGGNNNNSKNLHEEDDPMGRLLLGAVLSHDPPVGTVEYALRAFPRAIDRNPAAFFHACQDATTSSSEIVALLMRHQLKQQQNSSSSLSNNNDKEECPYPWILSEHITVEGAQALLQVYPMGVLQPSSLLSGGYCLLDYFLLSPEMVDQRGFDMTLWSKFKLILLAAEFCQGICCTSQDSCSRRRSIAPVHMILRRVFSTPGKLRVVHAAQRHTYTHHRDLTCPSRTPQIPCLSFPTHTHHDMYMRACLHLFVAQVFSPTCRKHVMYCG